MTNKYLAKRSDGLFLSFSDVISAGCSWAAKNFRIVGNFQTKTYDYMSSPFASPAWYKIMLDDRQGPIVTPFTTVDELH